MLKEYRAWKKNKKAAELEIKKAEQKLKDIKNSYKIEVAKLVSLQQECKDAANRKAALIDEETQYTYIDCFALKLDRDFSSDVRNEQLKEIVTKQKEIIKGGKAIKCSKTWHIDNKSGAGDRLVKNYSNLMIAAFDNQCDYIVDHVRFDNFDACNEKISRAFVKINRMGKPLEISITETYLQTKFAELHLYHLIQIKKQEEKEERRRKDEILKEQRALERQIERENKKLEEAAKIATEEKRIEIEQQIEKNNERIKTKSGWVYVITNPDFIKGCVKIGITRRDSIDARMSELSDASHAFPMVPYGAVWADDCFELEAKLHNRFADRKVNSVNSRKEWFCVSPEEVEQVLNDEFHIDCKLDCGAYDEQYIQSQRTLRNIGIEI